MPGGLFDTIDWALDCALEALILLAVLVFVCQSVRRISSAGTRCKLIAIGLLICLIVPVCNALYASDSASLATKVQGASASLTVWRERFADLFAGRMPRFYSIAIPFVCIWFSGALLLVINQLWLLGVAELEVLRWRRRGKQVPPEVLQKLGGRLSISKVPAIFIATDQGSACVKGLLSPVVLVPSSFEGLPELEREQILFHEVAHIRRGDLWLLLLARLTKACFWVVPTVWWATHRLTVEVERSCDDRVLGLGVSPKQYAETLVAAFARQAGLVSGTNSALPSNPSLELVHQVENAQRTAQLQQVNSDFHERLLAVIDRSLPRATNFVKSGLCIVGTLLIGLAIAKLNLIANALAPVGPVIFRAEISATSDDAEEMPEVGDVRLTSLNLELGYDRQKAKPNYVGLRFAHLDIPQGAKVDNAKILFCCDAKGQGSEVRLEVRCEQSASPAAFGLAPNDVSKRVQGGETHVLWVIQKSWDIGEVSPESTTPDLSPIVQQIVSRKDWRRGGAILFVISPAESTAPLSLRCAAPYDRQGLSQEWKLPTLEITYTAW